MAFPFNLFRRNQPTEPTTPIPAAPAAPKARRFSMRGAYVGAQYNRLNLDWNAALESADLEAQRDLIALRGRSRDLAKNNPLVARYLELVNTNVIGAHGIALQCRFRTSADTLNAPLNKAIEDGFAKWGQSATSDGRWSWFDVQQMLIKMVALDGEAFVILHDDLPTVDGFGLQIIDGDYLDVMYNRLAPETGNIIRCGVEQDQYGRPLAYWFWKNHPSELRGGQQRVRVPADKVIHLYRPPRNGHTRGIPWTAGAMFSLKQLGELQIAELVAARTSASKMGFIKSVNTDASPWLEDDAQGVMMDERFQADPGTIMRLMPGDEFVSWNPDHPSTAFEAFTRQVSRFIASALNVSYASLTGDYSTENFSAARLAYQQEVAHYKVLQQWLVRTLCQRVYEAWLTNAMRRGVLPDVPQIDPTDLFGVDWAPRGFDYYDPAKEISAIGTKIGLGLTSRTIEARKQGVELDSVFADLAHENEKAKELGIIIDATKPAPPPPTPPAPTDPAEADAVDTTQIDDSANNATDSESTE